MKNKITVAVSAALISVATLHTAAAMEPTEFTVDSLKAVKATSINKNKSYTSKRSDKIRLEKGLGNEQYTYIVRLKNQPVATYNGSVEGFSATNPQIAKKALFSKLVNSKKSSQQIRKELRLDLNAPEVKAYSNFLEGKQQDFISKANSKLGGDLTVVYKYKNAFNGMAVSLTQAQAAQLTNLSDVAYVERERIEHMDTDTGPIHIGATQVWSGEGQSAVNMGEGVIIGIIDSGVNTDHPSFADVGGDGYDTLKGGAGDDTFIQNAGDDYDVFKGGEGTDTIVRGEGEGDIGIRGNFGSENSIEVIDAQGNDIVGDSSSNTLDFRETELNNVDEIHGGRGNDNITGTDGDDTIVGGDGNDTLEGGTGNDILQGGRSDAGEWNFKLDHQGVLLSMFNADDSELAINANLSVHFPNFQEDPNFGPIDARVAFVQQEVDIVETSALLFQAVLARLPNNEEMNWVTTLGLDEQGLGQLAFDAYLNLIGPQEQSIEGQVSQLVSSVWGEQATTTEIIQIGVDFINQGGSWVDGLLYLAHHDNVRNKLIDSEGNLNLTQALVTGEVGWSEGTGNDTLRGGADDDILIGGRGSDILDGGSGVDIARQIGNAADYNFLVNDNGQLQLSTIHTNEDDILLSIETVVFGDQEFSTSASNLTVPTLKTVTVLADLINNGTTTLAGLNEFNNTQQTLLQFAQTQIETQGYLATWANVDNTVFIQDLSTEVLGSALTGEDLQFWVDQVDESLSRAEVFVIAVGVVDTTEYLGDGIILG